MTWFFTTERDRGRFTGGSGWLDGARVKYRFRTEAQVWDWWDKNEKDYIDKLGIRRARWLRLNQS